MIIWSYWYNILLDITLQIGSIAKRNPRNLVFSEYWWNQSNDDTKKVKNQVDTVVFLCENRIIPFEQVLFLSIQCWAIIFSCEKYYHNNMHKIKTRQCNIWATSVRKRIMTQEKFLYIYLWCQKISDKIVCPLMGM